MVFRLERKRSCPVSTQQAGERQGCGQCSWNSRLGPGRGLGAAGQRGLPVSQGLTQGICQWDVLGRADWEVRIGCGCSTF